MEPQLFRLLMEQYSHIHHFCVHMYYIYFQRPGATKGCLQRPGHIGTEKSYYLKKRERKRVIPT